MNHNKIRMVKGDRTAPNVLDHINRIKCNSKRSHKQKHIHILLQAIIIFSLNKTKLINEIIKNR